MAPGAIYDKHPAYCKYLNVDLMLLRDGGNEDGIC